VIDYEYILCHSRAAFLKTFNFQILKQILVICLKLSHLKKERFIVLMEKGWKDI
jgi:hypothetical protein